jgi:putative endonuclease
MKVSPWFVYIIQNEKGHLYTGITTDIERRFNEHSTSKKGAKFFRSGAPVKIVFKKKCPNRSVASKLEAAVKKLTKKQKLLLLETKRIKSC